MQLGLFQDGISLNGRLYRCAREAEQAWGGRWEFFYKGKWHRVVNYGIRTELNKIYNGQ